MNMNWKLKIALIRRSSEGGFAMPIALGLGLVMMLVGATMVVRSQGDQVTAGAQKATARGLSAAETGISRFQALINDNRRIALYPDCSIDLSGNSNRVNGVCNDTNTTASWANASAISGINSTCTNPTAATTVRNASLNISWQNIDATDPTKGQYRLISYAYGPTVGTPPGTGTLTVEGRVNQSSSGSSATNSAGTATTRLQVTIPIQTSSSSQIPFPGMWVNTTVDTGTVSANILASCTNRGYTSRAAFTSGYGISRANMPMPALPATPTTNIVTLTYASIPADATTTKKTLPRAQDIDLRTLDLVNNTNLANYNRTTGEYQYRITDNINDDLVITTNNQHKVAIYLQGNLDMTGSQKAVLHCTDPTTNPPTAMPISNCKPTDARIYGIGTGGSITFSLGGNASVCAIFLFAPNYPVDLNGGGGAQGCGGGANNNGVYWVNSWSGGGGGSHNALQQRNGLSWSDIANIFPNLLPPQISSTTSWQRCNASATSGC